MIGKIGKKQILKVCIFSFSILLILFSVSYAILEVRLGSTEKQEQKIEVEALSLESPKGEDYLVLENVVPKSDEEGMKQEAFTFQVASKVNADIHYILKLEEVLVPSFLSLEDIKFGLTKQERDVISSLGELKDGIIDLGMIPGKGKVDYHLRLWVRDDIDDSLSLQGQVLKFQLKILGNQEKVDTSKIRYENSKYTTCKNVECALNELYQKKIVGE